MRVTSQVFSLQMGRRRSRLQGNSIGSELLLFAVEACNANHLWALEKNLRAIRFYERHGFCVTDEKKLEEDTTEYLVCGPFHLRSGFQVRHHPGDPDQLSFFIL